MKIKVCGMKDSANIKELIELPIDFIGFIFHPLSPRYAKNLELEDVKLIPDSIEKVGVFVNEIPSRLFSYIEKYKFEAIQLHGDEEPRVCSLIKKKYPDLKIIKSFRIDNQIDTDEIAKYEDSCDYVLFDTKVASFGGSGNKFDWALLNLYNGNLPFFLSGGISVDDIDEIKSQGHPMLYAVDLNSKFESYPGMKDVELLDIFVNELKS